MKPHQVNLLHARIVSGLLRFIYDDSLYMIRPPTVEMRYLAEEVAYDALSLAYETGMYSEAEVFDWMVEQDLWSAERQKKLDSLPKDLEELKVRMYNFNFNYQALGIARSVLKAARADIEQLVGEKYAFRFASAEGFAEMEKAKFLIAASLYDSNNKPVLNHILEYSEFSTDLLEKCILHVQANKATESQIRYLARNEPWRSNWTAKKSGCAVLPFSTSEMTEDQRHLIIWSVIYDNAQEHTESPMPEVVEDDDIFDGWMIIQSRKVNAERGKKAAEDRITNSKIKDAKEVYLVARNQTELEQIASLNDVAADIIKRQRLNYVQKKGKVHEIHMPDSMLEIQGELAKKASTKAKGT